ncbi:hypothetical protein GGI42DRAFT_232487 [Trichoderma sp. SZMC 28013]
MTVYSKWFLTAHNDKNFKLTEKKEQKGKKMRCNKGVFFFFFFCLASKRWEVPYSKRKRGNMSRIPAHTTTAAPQKKSRKRRRLLVTVASAPVFTFQSMPNFDSVCVAFCEKESKSVNMAGGSSSPLPPLRRDGPPIVCVSRDFCLEHQNPLAHISRGPGGSLTVIST